MFESGNERTAKCPRCGTVHGEPEKVLCRKCRDELAASAGAAARSLKVQVTPLLREALASVQAGEDIDEALLRALKARYPEEAVNLLAAITRLVDIEAGHRGEVKDEVIRRLAQAVGGPELSISLSGRQESHGGSGASVSSTVSQTHVIRVGDEEYHSLEEAPAHIRQAIEAAQHTVRSGRAVVSSGARGARSRQTGTEGLRTGCSWALIALVLRLLGR